LESMAADREIVITGLGVVSPIGIGVEPFWASLCAGRSGIRPLPLYDDPTLPARVGGAVADFDPKQYVRPRKSLKVMSRDIQLGFAAADMACADAGLREGLLDPERLGVILGADIIFCDLDEIASTYRNCIVDGRFDFCRWGQAFPAELFPLWMLKYLPNMPACHVGIAQDARGPNNTVTIGDVSTLSAISEAARVLDRGQADAMIAGGVGGKIHPALWPRSLVTRQTTHGGDPAAACRPFDALRNGLVSGEGAGTLILETRRHAQARGAQIRARMLGYAAAFEPRRNGQPCQGSAIRRAIVAALGAAGLRPDGLGFVAAHGLSTVDSDRIEAQAIRDTLGDVPVTALKCYFGYLGAASGALEAVLSVLALRSGQVPATLNYEHPDPECPVNVIRGQPLSLSRSTALILSHSPHGQAVAVVLGGESN
jgi:3-oxoacyl-[acyl-carrier-protein] synthase II